MIAYPLLFHFRKVNSGSLYVCVKDLYHYLFIWEYISGLYRLDATIIPHNGVSSKQRKWHLKKLPLDSTGKSLHTE